MIVIVSNREIKAGATDDTLFGDNPNPRSLDEIRLAIATFDKAAGRWRTELMQEADPMNTINPPSKILFNRIVADIEAKQNISNWIFYIHGFNQSLKSNLNVCRQLQERYDVNVLVFSWPSNQGGFVTREYRDARQAAKASSNALDRTLEKLGGYLIERASQMMQNPANKAKCTISLNLLAHSLGGYLLENFIKSPIFSSEMRIFDNVIFHQADVDMSTHDRWIDLIDSKRVYVTINERDSVLKASGVINPARLGNTAENLTAKRAIYVDFTDTPGVDDTHDIFLDATENPAIARFCKRVLTGGRGELTSGFKYNSRMNAYRVE